MIINDLEMLISLLSEKEVKKIQKAFPAKKIEFILYKKLFKALLLREKGTSEREICIALYGQEVPSSESSHQKLLYRMRKKILEIFYDCKYENSEEMDKIDLEKYKLMKLIGQIYSIGIRGASIKLVNKLRDEAMAIALRYEFYNILVDQLELQKTSKSLLEGENIVKKYNEKIRHYQSCYEAVSYAFELDSLLKFHSAKLSSPGSKRLKEVESNRDCLLALYKKTKSPTVKYFYLFHDFYLSNEKFDYVSAGNIGISLLSLINKSPSLKRKPRLAIINVNLALNRIFLGKYKESLVYSYFANQIFKKGSKNYYMTLEQVFFASFYSEDLETAEQTIIYMKEEWKNKVNEFEFGKLDIYQSYIDFKKGNYSIALEKLLRVKEVLEDTAGWDFTIRVFSIMIFLLQNKDDSASPAFENLQRQYYRIVKNKELRKRDEVIYQLLLNLYKQGFNLSKTEKVLYLKQELERNPDHRWEHMTAELIPFERLLDQKYNKIKNSDSVTAA